MLVSILGQLIWTDSLGDFYITKCIKIYLPLCKWWTTFSETMPFHPSRGSIGSSCVKCWFLFYMIGFANKICVCCLFGSFKVNKHNNIINRKMINWHQRTPNETGGQYLHWYFSVKWHHKLISTLIFQEFFSLKQLLVKMNYTNRNLTKYIGLENADTMFEHAFHLPVMVQNLHAKNCRLYLFIFWNMCLHRSFKKSFCMTVQFLLFRWHLIHFSQGAPCKKQTNIRHHSSKINFSFNVFNTDAQ